MTGNTENPQVTDTNENLVDENAVSIFDEITGNSDTDSSDKNRVLDKGDELELDSGNVDETDGSEETDDAEAKQNGGKNSQSQDGDSGDSNGETPSQKELEALQRDHKANSGRVRALNQKLAEARETIRKLKEQPSGGDGPTDDELKELENDFPEAARLARAYADRIKRDLQADLIPVHAAMDSSFEQQQQAITAAELGRVQQAHPDYAQIATGQNFRSWLSRQSDGVKGLYASDSADDAIVLLNLYKGAFAPQSQGHLAAKARNPKDSLGQHAELPRKGASRAGVEPDDPVEIFNSIA